MTKNLQTSKEPRRLALKATNLRLVKERLGEEGKRGKLGPTFLGFPLNLFFGLPHLEGLSIILMLIM